MKFAIICAFLQMSLGLFLQLFNAIHFKKKLDIYFGFLPQILFLWCFVGYMCALFFFKWSIDWTAYLATFPKKDDIQAPQLITSMIYMFISPVKTDGFKPGLYGSDDGSTMETVQVALLIILILCIPWMLLPKPFILKSQHANKTRYEVVVHDEEDSDSENNEEEEFDFANEFTHQVIHTIEFVLGAVSNTASYLRLWALSLAHAELSKVFWEQIMVLGMESTGGTGIAILFVGFAAWASFSFFVLLLMESLSAFLHTLRLHWVEFQNKFFWGDGKLFEPFSYQAMFTEGDNN